MQKTNVLTVAATKATPTLKIVVNGHFTVATNKFIISKLLFERIPTPKLRVSCGLVTPAFLWPGGCKLAALIPS